MAANLYVCHANQCLMRILCHGTNAIAFDMFDSLSLQLVNLRSISKRSLSGRKTSYLLVIYKSKTDLFLALE